MPRLLADRLHDLVVGPRERPLRVCLARIVQARELLLRVHILKSPFPEETSDVGRDTQHERAANQLLQTCMQPSLLAVLVERSCRPGWICQADLDEPLAHTLTQSERRGDTRVTARTDKSGDGGGAPEPFHEPLRNPSDDADV